MKTKEFHLSDILSVTTGLMLSTRHMDGLYDILSFMTEDSVFTTQIPRAGDACKPVILKKYPKLGDISFDKDRQKAGLSDKAWKNAGNEERKVFINDWLNKQIKIHGEFLLIETLPPFSYEYKDPITETLELMNKGSQKSFVQKVKSFFQF